jgi:23S rRNA pseudouridine1911/1915/1917 synthase
MTGELQTAVGSDLAGKTVLAALRQLEPGASWSQLRGVLASRHILVNGVLCLEEARRLRLGDVIERQTRPAPPPPGAESVRIVYRDADILVVDKPEGLLTERRIEEARWSDARKAQRPTLDEIVRGLLKSPSRRLSGREPCVGLVHRLDRETSGLLVLALNPRAEENLIAQFRDHSARRSYLAVVVGTPQPQTIRTRITRDRGDGLRGNSTQGLPAVTHITVVESFAEYSLIRCELETGRTNQIRVHLAELGHPVCGDGKYRGPLGRPVADDSSAPRLALHATRLELRHPESGKAIGWDAPLPVELTSWLMRLRVSP